jgi:hypothetical protein
MDSASWLWPLVALVLIAREVAVASSGASLGRDRRKHRFAQVRRNVANKTSHHGVSDGVSV